MASTTTTTTSTSGANFLPPLPKASSSVPGIPSNERTEVEQTSTSTIIVPPTSSSTDLSNISTIAAQATSSLSPSPTSTLTAQSTGVPASAFYGFAGGIAALIIAVGGFLWYRWARRRARKREEIRNAARARILSQGLAPIRNSFSVIEDRRAPQSSARSWTSSEWDARSNITPRRPLPPSANRPAPIRGALHSSTHNRNMARLDALREGNIKAEAERRAHFAALSQADELERETTGAGYEVSRSDESAFDLDRRGPAVNPAYAAAREERYQQKLALGMTAEQAMSVSDASTETGDPEGSEGPLAAWVVGTPATLPHIRNPQSRGKTQLAPRVTPSRWLGSGRGIDKGTRGEQTRGAPPGGTGRALREEDPIDERDSDRLSQIDLAYTEEDTMTRASTMISDDPWRDEVLEHRKQGR